MARDYQIPGQTMVFVKGNSSTSIAALSQLGLSEFNGITITFNDHKDDITVDPFGPNVPADVQTFLGEATISMSLVHFDLAVLQTCFNESMGGPSAEGQVGGGGVRLGGGVARFAPGNHYIGLNLSSPVGNNPWRFLFSYMTGPMFTWPVGTKRSIVQVNWRAIPYTIDPWNAGQGSLNVPVYDHVLDT